MTENGKQKPKRQQTLDSLERSAVRAITSWLLKLPSERSRMRVLRMVGDRVQEAMELRTLEQAEADRARVSELEASRQTYIPGTSKADEETGF